MDDVTFCDQLWDLIEPFLTVKQRVVLANSIADLLEDYGVNAYSDTDWYNEYGTQTPEEDEEEE
jgi:hypothetical protein